MPEDGRSSANCLFSFSTGCSPQELLYKSSTPQLLLLPSPLEFTPSFSFLLPGNHSVPLWNPLQVDGSISRPGPTTQVKTCHKLLNNKYFYKAYT